jgi:hypothetical protein
MSERIHELLLRNLLEVFGEGDSAKRRSAIEELYTDDCVVYAPPGILVGHDALDKFAGDLRATHPHFAYVPHASPQALHNAGCLAWDPFSFRSLTNKSRCTVANAKGASPLSCVRRIRCRRQRASLARCLSGR